MNLLCQEYIHGYMGYLRTFGANPWTPTGDDFVFNLNDLYLWFCRKLEQQHSATARINEDGLVELDFLNGSDIARQRMVIACESDADQAELLRQLDLWGARILRRPVRREFIQMIGTLYRGPAGRQDEVWTEGFDIGQLHGWIKDERTKYPSLVVYPRPNGDVRIDTFGGALPPQRLVLTCDGEFRQELLELIESWGVRRHSHANV